MEKQMSDSRPQEALLGQSAPYHWKRIMGIYGGLIVLIAVSAGFFTLNGAMDRFQILLTALTLLCVAAGMLKAVQTAKTKVLLYDTWFQVGEKAFSYGEIYQLEQRREQVSFRTGKGVMEKHSFFAGNAEALCYILRKKAKEARRTAQKSR